MAHLAKRQTVNLLDKLYLERDMALERVIAARNKRGISDGEKSDEEFSRALDDLTLAHLRATFEWASGSA